MTFDATRLAKKHLAACMLAFVMVGYSTIPAFATQTETTSYMMPVTAQIGLSASGCSNSPGPYVTLDGALDLSPISTIHIPEQRRRNAFVYVHRHSKRSTAGCHNHHPKTAGQWRSGRQPVYLRPTN